MKKYTIEVNEKQLEVLECASELILRIGLLQYNHLFNVIGTMEKNFNYDHDVFSDISDKLRNLVGENEFITHKNASRGVGNDSTPEIANIACDLYQAIRYTRSWSNAEHNPNERGKHFSKYFTVNYDEPMNYSNEPLPKVKKID